MSRPLKLEECIGQRLVFDLALQAVAEQIFGYLKIAASKISQGFAR